MKEECFYKAHSIRDFSAETVSNHIPLEDDFFKDTSVLYDLQDLCSLLSFSLLLKYLWWF